MKKLLKRYSKVAQHQAMLWAIWLLSSCQLLEVEENFAIKNQRTPIPNLEVVFGASTNFDLSSAEGAFVDLIFKSDQTFNGQVEIYATLNTTQGSAVLVSTIAGIPNEIKLAVDAITLAFEDQNVELANGDSLYFSFQSIIDGESYRFNNTALSSNVICNSMISTAEDNWTGTANTNNGPSFPASATTETVKIIPLGDDRYLISDISAGWFDAIGFRAIQEGIYEDNCNRITWVRPGENRQFDFVSPDLEGEWNPQSQTLVVYWYDIGNDFSGQSVFTKN